MLYYTLKSLGESEKVASWKSKGLSAKKLTTFTTDNTLSPSIKWYENSNFYLLFKRSYLKQKNATITLPNIIFFLLFIH